MVIYFILGAELGNDPFWATKNCQMSLMKEGLRSKLSKNAF